MSSKNTAQEIAQKIANASAVTLAYGYCIRASGERELFEAGRVLSERRNKAGRCTRMEAGYADGSRLLFTWSEAQGARYTVQA